MIHYETVTIVRNGVIVSSVEMPWYCPCRGTSCCCPYDGPKKKSSKRPSHD